MKLLFPLLVISAHCLLCGLVTEKFVVVVSHDPIKAAVGEDVILPCHLKPPSNARSLTVKWRFNEECEVLTYRSGEFYPYTQDERFKNRTQLFHKEMVNGNISLKLLNVTEQDTGIYTCCVRRVKGKITLDVVPKGGEEDKYVNPTSGPDTTTHKNLSTAEIIGISFGVIAFIAIVIIVIIVIVIKRKRGRQQEDHNEVNLDETENLQPQTTSQREQSHRNENNIELQTFLSGQKQLVREHLSGSQDAATK